GQHHVRMLTDVAPVVADRRNVEADALPIRRVGSLDRIWRLTGTDADRRFRAQLCCPDELTPVPVAEQPRVLADGKDQLSRSLRAISRNRESGLQDVREMLAFWDWVTVVLREEFAQYRRGHGG